MAVLFAPFVLVFVGEAEPGLALQPVFLLYLGGVLSGLEVKQPMGGLAQKFGDIAIKIAEKGVVVGLVLCGAIPHAPEHGAAIELPPREAKVGFFLANQTIAFSGFEQG